MSQPLWRPSADAITQANLTRFALGLGFTPPDYRPLHAFSVDQRASFWDAVWDFCDIVGDRGQGPSLAHGDRFPRQPLVPRSATQFRRQPAPAPR